MSSDLERRYRRVLRLLPAYYRNTWEEDMVGAFLDSWLTGDRKADEYIARAAGPSWAEVASVISLAARLYLGGAAAPRRYLTWGQAVRCAALTMTLVQAVRGLDGLVLTAWSRHVFGWLPAPPETITASSPGGLLPPAAWYVVDYLWIVAFVLLLLRYYRTAQALAALAIVPDLFWLVQGQLTGALPATAFGPWAFWGLINLIPVLAMTAFRRDAPPAPRWPWLLALPASYLLVAVPLLALQAAGNSAWTPDFSGLCCILVALGCVAYRISARTRSSPRSSVWSLTLVLLAADAGAYRIFSSADYLHRPHMIAVSLIELLILVAGVVLIVPDTAATLAGADLDAALAPSEQPTT
jgi:hypothetical protein